MKVYYNSSLWDKSRGIPGRPQKVNLEFEHNGLKRIIPTIYHFSKGIVFDLITIVDENEFCKFYEKYKDLDPLEQRIVEQEHPYQAMDIGGIWINDIKVEEGYSSSGTFFTPWNEDENELNTIRENYQSILKGVSCFYCDRYQIPYPKTGFKIERLLRFFHLYKIKEIKLNTYPIKKFYPLNVEFEMSLGENLKEISFIHPITGTKHKLYFQNPELVEIQDFYFIQSMYEIEPELSEGSNLQFDSSFQYSAMSMVDTDSNSASSIGIIGGASGPTAIFIAGKEKDINYGQNDLPLHSSLSVPSLEKQDKFKFILDGIHIKVHDSEEYEFRL